HDFRAGLLAQEGFSQHADDVVTLDELAVLIEEKAAIEIAIPGDTQISVMRFYGINRRRAIFFQQRIRNTVREFAIRLVMHLDEFERQKFFDTIDHQTGAAIAGIDDNFQRLQRGNIDVGQQVFYIVRSRIEHRVIAATKRRYELILLGDFLDIEQTGIATDRSRTFADEFHAVVVFGIVAGSYRDTAIHRLAIDLRMKGREVDFFGTAQTDIENIDAAVAQPIRQGLFKRLAGQSNIAADDNLFRLDDLRISAADAIGDFVVELIRNATTHVIGFKTRQLVSHCVVSVGLVNIFVNEVGGFDEAVDSTAIKSAALEFVGHDTAVARLRHQRVGDLH